MAKLVQRISHSQKILTKSASELAVGDTVMIDDMTFKIYQIDKTKNGFCLVDKYACDYNVTKNQKIEIIKGVDELRQDTSENTPDSIV